MEEPAARPRGRETAPDGRPFPMPSQRPTGLAERRRAILVEEPHGHTPVLPVEVAELLAVQAGDVIADVTLGLGGHARMLAEAAGAGGRLIGLDVDPANLDQARRRLEGLACPFHLVHANFAELPAALASAGVTRVDVLLADLGVSSTHLDDPERGFSFRNDGPLDMRMDPRIQVTAAEMINRIGEQELGDILYHNAQEMASRRIARAIYEARRRSRIVTTGQLVTVVCSALGVDPNARRSKIHPATKTFQALRIAVNDEIRCLERLLQLAPDVLNPGGRIGVIAFHSIEDKPVKVDFRTRKSDGIYDILTKHPVTAGERERLENPRSRSAKLRVAVRLG